MSRYEPHPNAPTLVELVANGHRLEIWCCGCHRIAYLAPADAVALLGPRTTFSEASRRLRCTICGARGRDGMVSARSSVLDHYAALRKLGVGLPSSRTPHGRD